jgi:hypothetical protein
MTKSDAERCYLAYKKISTKSTPTPFKFKLYFIVTTLKETEWTHGVNSNMRRNMDIPLELTEVKHGTPYSFVLKAYFVDGIDFDNYYYDYRDVIITEKTKGIIDLILSADKPQKITASKKQTFKFDEKNIYNFKEKRKSL